MPKGGNQNRSLFGFLLDGGRQVDPMIILGWMGVQK